MKKLSMILTGAALAVCAGFFLNGCSSSTAPGAGVGSPSTLMAISKNASTISIKWIRGSGDTSADTVIISGGGAPPQAIPTSNTASSAEINGLTTGTVYTITVASIGGQSSSLNWMTANRTMGLHLYQFSSSGTSGLILGGGQASVVSASSANAGTMDLYLEDIQHDPTITSTSGISLESTDFLNGSSATYRKSFMDGAATYVVGGLDSDYSSSDFSSQLNGAVGGAVNAYDIPNDAGYDTKGSRILLVRTQDGNLAKVEIVPDPSTGMLYSGSGTNKYITVNVSYQPVAGQPYAGRALPHGSNVRPVRVLAQP
jgi:hypothetical protein